MVETADAVAETADSVVASSTEVVAAEEAVSTEAVAAEETVSTEVVAADETVSTAEVERTLLPLLLAGVAEAEAVLVLLSFWIVNSGEELPESLTKPITVATGSLASDEGTSEGGKRWYIRTTM